MTNTPQPAPDLLREDELEMLSSIRKYGTGHDWKDYELWASRLRESRNDNNGLRRSVQEALLQVSNLREELAQVESRNKELVEALAGLNDAAKRFGPDMLNPWIHKANAALAKNGGGQP